MSPKVHFSGPPSREPQPVQRGATLAKPADLTDLPSDLDLTFNLSHFEVASLIVTPYLLQRSCQLFAPVFGPPEAFCNVPPVCQPVGGWHTLGLPVSREGASGPRLVCNRWHRRCSRSLVMQASQSSSCPR